MMLMAIDHIRDYVAHSAMRFSPTDLSHTTAPIFLTRWTTHSCAPVFLLTAGIGVFLWRERGQPSELQLQRFLAMRGLWLILLEIMLLRVIMFSDISYRSRLVTVPVIHFLKWSRSAINTAIDPFARMER
jgi:uncharacterized membrane protein